jgi:hypothetical protein
LTLTFLSNCILEIYFSVNKYSATVCYWLHSISLCEYTIIYLANIVLIFFLFFFYYKQLCSKWVIANLI